MTTTDATGARPESDITRLLREMRLDEALQSLKRSGGTVDTAALGALIAEHESRARQLHTAGQTGEARRVLRRAAALSGLLTHGPDPHRMVPEVDLAQGYRGKILLVVLNGGGFDSRVCLRSGDDLHRQILHNTRAEMQDLGFTRTRVHPLGGAYADFGADGSITLWGTSEEFGCCDKGLAARLIARAYPGRTVRIEAG